MVKFTTELKKKKNKICMIYFKINQYSMCVKVIEKAQGKFLS